MDLKFNIMAMDLDIQDFTYRYYTHILIIYDVLGYGNKKNSSLYSS